MRYYAPKTFNLILRERVYTGQVEEAIGLAKANARDIVDNLSSGDLLDCACGNCGQIINQIKKKRILTIFKREVWSS